MENYLKDPSNKILSAIENNEDLIFYGGLSNHPKRGMRCKIDFPSEVHPNYYYVIFEDNSNCICHASNLETLENDL